MKKRLCTSVNSVNLWRYRVTRIDTLASAERPNFPFSVKLAIVSRVKLGEKLDIPVTHEIPENTLLK